MASRIALCHDLSVSAPLIAELNTGAKMMARRLHASSAPHQVGSLLRRRLGEPGCDPFTCITSSSITAPRFIVLERVAPSDGFPTYVYHRAGR